MHFKDHILRERERETERAYWREIFLFESEMVLHLQMVAFVSSPAFIREKTVCHQTKFFCFKITRHFFANCYESLQVPVTDSRKRNFRFVYIQYKRILAGRWY